MIPTPAHSKAVADYVRDRLIPLDQREAACVGIVAALARVPRLRDVLPVGAAVDASIREGI